MAIRDDCFVTECMKLLIVSPNNTIWEITVADNGVISAADTGDTYVPPE